VLPMEQSALAALLGDLEQYEEQHSLPALQSELAQLIRKSAPSLRTVNELAEELALQQAGLLIRDLDSTQKDVVRRIIAKGIRLGWSNADMAAAMKNKIGLDARYAAAVENFRDGELAGGVSPGVADRHAQAYAGRLRKARAARIVGYEVQKALNDAQRLLWRQEQADGNVSRWAVRTWTLHKDEKLCKVCKPMNGRRASIGLYGGYDVPGFGRVEGPPVHPNCRCSESLQDEGIVKAQQYPELWWESVSQ
jgi:hypothetical protein